MDDIAHPVDDLDEPWARGQNDRMPKGTADWFGRIGLIQPQADAHAADWAIDPKVGNSR